MANNCLVTKLKGTVDNDNILKLGEIRFKQTISAATIFRFGIKGSEQSFTDTYTATIISEDGIFTNGNVKTKTIANPVTDYEIGANSYPTDIIVSLVGKKNIGYVAGGKFYNDLKSIGYATSAREINLGYGFVDETIMEADANDLSNVSVDTLESLKFPQIYGFTIKNVSAIRRFKNLTSLTMSRTTIDNGIALETLLNAWFAAGRTSGTCTIICFGTVGVTYNGSSFAASKTFVFSGSGWSEQA